MKFSDKEKGIYVLWVIVNIVILSVYGKMYFNDGSFYPFSNGFEDIDRYDISEFLVYTTVPLLIMIAAKYLNFKDIIKKLGE